MHFTMSNHCCLVRDNSVDDILNLLELVVGAAVMNNDSDARSEFIQNIFSLDHTSQTYLKDLIQSAMARAEDIGDEEELGFTQAAVDQGSSRETALEEAVIRAEEAARHLREEQHRLLETIAELESQNRSLTAG